MVQQRADVPEDSGARPQRDDLVVRPLSWLEPRNVMGRAFPGVVVDHAAHYSAEAQEALHYLRARGVLVAG